MLNFYLLMDDHAFEKQASRDSLDTTCTIRNLNFLELVSKNRQLSVTIGNLNFLELVSKNWRMSVTIGSLNFLELVSKNRRLSVKT